MRARAPLWGAVLTLLVLLPSPALATPSGGCTLAGPTVTCTFLATAAPESWTVPTGIAQVTFDVFGGQGGQLTYAGAPQQAEGAHVHGVLATSSGEALEVRVGGKGQDDRCAGGAAGGFNGGGTGGDGVTAGFVDDCGAGGGGASDVRTAPFTSAERALVAGGGGGGGGIGTGGAAGGASGGDGANSNVFGMGSTAAPSGLHGTLAGGGAGGTGLATAPTCASANGVAGSSGNGGDGGDGPNESDFTYGGGGGGGGYFGGGGGAAGVDDHSSCKSGGGGGGGGSSYPDPVSPPSGVSGVTIQDGQRTGDGSITVTYTLGPPTATVTTPADGAVLERGQAVDASYGCADADTGPGIQTCSGPLADGAPLDTSATGSFSFAVTATSTDGLSATVTHHYTVRDTTAPLIAVLAPADGSVFDQGQQTVARYVCIDSGGGAVARCAGTVANGAALDTSAVGVHTFAVIGVDAAGNVATKTVHYTVRGPQLGLSVAALVRLGNGRARFPVTCRPSFGTLARCTVTARHGATTVAQGSVSEAGVARVRLTSAGASLLDRSLRPVAIRLDARATRGLPGALSASATAKLVRAVQIVTTPVGSFTASSAELTAAGERALRRLASRLGGVRSITCTGYTADLGRGQTSSARALGRARAAATCQALHGVHAHSVVASRGTLNPVASNATAGGRERNRRVRIVIRH